MEKPKFRCSGNGHLMTDPKLKADKDAGNLSEGSKTHVVNTWTSWKFQRNEEIYSKYIEKGNEVEQDSITSVSVTEMIYHIKNPIHFENDWIKGTPDFLIRNKEGQITTVEDTKTSWDIFTFQRAKNKPLNKLYYWQMQSYMWLTGATNANIRYCLENATADLILDEKRKLAFALRCFGCEDLNADYKLKAAQLERLMIYDLKSFRNRFPGYDFDTNLAEWNFDVPAKERMFTIPIARSDEDIERLKSKVIKAWQFMENL